MTIRHRFVENIPEVLEQGVLYVSLRYRTMVHRCACGCGEEVVTPIGPAAWTMTYDGGGVSITPSIGNWSLPCRSHYWIERNRVLWAPWLIRPNGIASKRPRGVAGQPQPPY